LKVHSFVLMARSPVFYLMLTTDMVEKRQKVVTITDWDLEVVKEMVDYMYTATISPEFSRISELLALADKYNVTQLVSHCSNQLAVNISPETALELGVFGETHNAVELVDKCAMFISKDLSCLTEDWVDRSVNSPKLTTSILQHIKDGREKEMVVDRFGMTVRGTYGILGKRDAVQFMVTGNISSQVFLSGLGLYGTMQEEEKLQVKVSVLQDKMILTHFSTKWECDGTIAPHIVTFPHPVNIEPHATYTVMLEIVGSGFIFQGHHGVAEVDLVHPTIKQAKGRVVFSSSPLSTNGTDVRRGALPRLVFKTHV